MDNGTLPEKIVRDVVTGQTPVNRLKRLLTIIGNVLTALSLAYLIIKLIQNFKNIPSFSNGFDLVIASLVSSVVLCASFMFLAIAWSILLKGGGVHLPFIDSFRIMGEAQVGKYLPGNVFQYIRRASLGAAFGITAEVSTLSMGVETVLLIISAIIIVFVHLFFGQTNISWIEDLVAERTTSILVVAGIILAAVVLLVVNKKTRRWLYERRGYVDAKRAILSLLLYVLFFFVMGINIFLLVHFAWQKEIPLQWYDYTWGFTAAWLLGFIVPGAPGGIGIREAAILAIYGPVMGDGIAASLAVLWRFITTIGDLVTFLIAYVLSKRKLKNSN
jgi:glycosyltransferase 2 family protein